MAHPCIFSQSLRQHETSGLLKANSLLPVCTSPNIVKLFKIAPRREMSLTSLVFHSSWVQSRYCCTLSSICNFIPNLSLHESISSIYLFIHLAIFIYISTIYSASQSSIHPCASRYPFSNHILIYEYLPIIYHLLVYSSVLFIYLFLYSLCIYLFNYLSFAYQLPFNLCLLLAMFLIESQIHILNHFLR